MFDGKDMAHYVNEGAAGVQIATRFIATNECDASDTFKQVVVNAKREDIRIIKALLECRHVQLTVHCLKGLMQEKPSRQENVMVVLQHVRRMTVYHIA